ncbi:carbohydrate ABC transporter permease [Paenibacillus pinisoli]|uniref:Carbohydrate ABC transporter permease n=1 Tax=Paenibacillus pinisoli TaxID=1276110 RepID=A0A3A6PTT1_9BACL|nr:carbohydrate ABC transporter permease [Paenibacillus pinisoli]RJX40111.1 carbohydrate ABC transporter permease [Paenibacillus pinisoli]
MKKRQLLEAIPKYIFLSLLAALVIFPIFYVVVSSLKNTASILASSSFFPKTFSWDNYVRAWNLSNFKVYTWNSIYMCATIVLGTIVTSITSGYVFSRGRFMGKKPLLALITFSMFISAGSLFLYPQLNIAKALNLNNSLWGVIIIYIFGINVTNLYLAKGFIDGIPKEIDEAARVDGCSFFRIFWSIIFPLTKPLIATVGLLAFMNSWNDYLLPMVFTLGNPDKQPLVVGIVSMKSSGESVTSWDLMMAGTVMAVIPMLVVFISLNKYFVSGLTSGAVKG